jgi:hypothetical protein
MRGVPFARTDAGRALENRRILFMGRAGAIKGAMFWCEALSASGGDWKLTLAEKDRRSRI